MNGGFNLSYVLSKLMEKELGTIEDSFTNTVVSGVVRDSNNLEVGITAYAITDLDVFDELDYDTQKPFFVIDSQRINPDDTFDDYMPLGAASILKYLESRRAR